MRAVSVPSCLFAAAVFLSSTPALASSVDAETSLVHDDSSEANRQRLTLELLYGLTGYTVGWFTSPDHVLELGYSGLASPAFGDGGDRWHEQAFLRSRSFWGNSFYSYWGLTGRRSGPGDGTKLPRDYDEAAGLIDIGLGNQWQWSNITVGVDWAQLSLPVYRERIVTAAAVAPGTDDRRVGGGPHAFDRLEWHVLQAYIGICF